MNGRLEFIPAAADSDQPTLAELQRAVSITITGDDLRTIPWPHCGGEVDIITPMQQAHDAQVEAAAVVIARETGRPWQHLDEQERTRLRIAAGNALQAAREAR